MYVVTWQAGKVSTQASVDVPHPISGARLRDIYMESVKALTFGLAKFRNNSVVVGPVTLLRFGRATVTRTSVDWPIEGGLLTGASGGHLRIQSSAGHVEAVVTGYRPILPRPLYAATHLQVHLLFTRLYLLGLRGREPSPGPTPSQEDRIRAAGVDVAFCLTLARLTGRRRLGRTIAVAAAYHVVCWSVWGRTLGGIVMRQRVVAVDGTPLLPTQAMLRFALLPTSWISRRPIHDEIAQSSVIAL